MVFGVRGQETENITCAPVSRSEHERGLHIPARWWRGLRWVGACAALMKPCTLQIQERCALSVDSLMVAGDRGSDGHGMPVQFCRTVLGVLVVEEVACYSIVLNQQLFVGEASWCLLIEFCGRDIFHQLQGDTHQSVIKSQKRHRRVTQCRHDRRH